MSRLCPAAEALATASRKRAAAARPGRTDEQQEPEWSAYRLLRCANESSRRLDARRRSAQVGSLEPRDGIGQDSAGAATPRCPATASSVRLTTRRKKDRHCSASTSRSGGFAGGAAGARRTA